MSSACTNHLRETSSSFRWKSCQLKSRSIHKRRWSPLGRPWHIGCFRPKPMSQCRAQRTEEDQSRLESLSMLFGVGLVLFDLDKTNPRFSIRVRAQRFSPDMFYVNEFAERLKLHDSEVFEQLFR